MIDQVEVDLRPVLRHVRDQAARPTCLAHAASAAHEYARRSVAQLSPEYLHFFAKVVGSSFGSSMTGVAEALKAEGQPEEDQCPYFPADPPHGWRPQEGLQVFRRASELSNADTSAIEESIRAGCLPVLGISVPEPFFDPQAPWLISPDGAIHGLHAVTGVGLGQHQTKRVFLIRNSWGTDWGDGGYAWLDDAFLARHLREVLILTYEEVS